MTRELLGGDTKAAQEYEYEGETEVDKVVGKFINRRKSYNIDFPIGVIIPKEDIKLY